MAEGRPNSRLNPIPCGEDRSFLSYTIGKAMAPQASPYFVHLSLVCEREIEWQDDADSSKYIPHSSRQRGPFGRDYVLRRIGTIWRKFII